MKQKIYQIFKIIAIALIAISTLSVITVFLGGFSFQDAFVLTGCVGGAILYLLCKMDQESTARRQEHIELIVDDVRIYVLNSLQQQLWLTSIPTQAAQNFYINYVDFPNNHQIKVWIGFMTANRNPLNPNECSLLKKVIQQDMDSKYENVLVSDPYYAGTMQYISVEIPVW